MKIGDKVIFYLGRRKSKFLGTFTVTSKYLYDNTPFWKGDIRPHRIRLKPDIVASNEEQLLDVKCIKDKLSFIKNEDRWYIYFQTGIREISKDDFDLIKSELIKQIERTL